MKKVLYLTRSSEYGGMEKHILDLILGLRGGFEFHVICPKGEMADKYRLAGAKVAYFKPKDSIDFSYGKKVKDYVIAHSIDIIHTHELEVSVLGLWGVRGVKNVKKIMHVHTPITSWRHSLFARFSKAPLNWIANFITANFIADVVLALTEEIRKERVFKEWIRGKKIVIIPNAINVKEFDYTREEKRDFNAHVRNQFNVPMDAVLIGNVGRLTVEKGHNLLLKVFGRVYREEKDKYLLIAGGGELEGELNVLAKNLGIKDRVVITGRFSDDEKKMYYASFDYFVFPSLAEGFGYVLMEALLNKIPTISSNLPVLREVAEDSVFYFDSGSVDDLSDKLNKLVSGGVLIDTERGKRLVEKKYSMESFVKNYKSLYQSL